MLTNDLFDVPKRKHIREINIVPILDMLTTIIFFLLLSTSFLQYNKLTIPPSRTSVITNPETPPPLQGRMVFARLPSGDFRLLLHWAGVKPGAYSENFPSKLNPLDLERQVAQKATEFAEQYRAQFAQEKTLQLGLGKKIELSKLILLMDSVRESLPDVVLVSAIDAQVEAEKYAGASTDE